ncbi:PASTA domain-containing protein [Sciscionella sediminilitoris]|uniref:PASTA domain-containing protein n=1 Tax=Sciscionella sediminilitoris TaxID=1445613 RepID=UPI0009E86043
MSHERRVEVPDVRVLGVVEACGAVRGTGLPPCGPQHAPEPIDGTIVRQDPAPGASVDIGNDVTLWSGNGRAGQKVLDPDLTTAAAPKP